MTVAGVATPTILNTGAGGDNGDNVTIGQATGSIGLTGITASLTIQESGNANDRLTVLSNISSALTLDRTSPTVGLVTGVGSTSSPGKIFYSGVTTLAVNQSDIGAASTLTINNTVTKTVVESGGGGHTITVNNVSNETALNLGAKDDATVLDAGAAVSVAGDVTNTLTLDLSATTNALNAQILDGPTAGSSAILRGFMQSGGDINVSNVGKVTVDEGTGNDTIEINTTDATSVLTLNAASGDNTYVVKAIGAETSIIGGKGTDTATLVIPNFPTAGQFAKLNATVANLFVDNSAYTAAVAWSNTDGSIFAAQGGGALVLVVNASSAELTKIIGAAGRANTLNVTSTSSGGVTGTITDHKVVLAAGLDVLTDPNNATYLNYSNAMSFDTLQSGATAYTESGFKLATSNAAGFVLDDVISPSAEYRIAADMFTLTAADDSPFTLYSLQFANTGATSQQIVLRGDTISGGQVTLAPITISGSGFRTVTLKQSDGFSGLTKVYWTTGTTAVDNIVSIKTPGATAQTRRRRCRKSRSAARPRTR